MKRFVCFLLLASLPLSAQMMRQQRSEPQRELEVTPWVLAKPAGRTITMMDLTRRLDMLLRRTAPDVAHLADVRFQFFSTNWRPVLDEMINSQLIVADAAEKEVVATDGEIRQELEAMFGPTVVETIDQLGMTFDEAWEMVETDLIVRRMKSYMVAGRAYSDIRPTSLQQEYEKLAAEQTGHDEWHYRMLSIRHQDLAEAEKAAKIAAEFIDGMEVPNLEIVQEKMEDLRRAGEIDIRTTVRASDMEQRTLESLASAHRDTLVSLCEGECSEPVGQVSRHDRCMVYRIFHLVAFVEEQPPTFSEVEGELNSKLLGEAMNREYGVYVGKLRRHFGLGDDYLAQMIPEDFTPFVLR